MTERIELDETMVKIEYFFPPGVTSWEDALNERPRTATDNTYQAAPVDLWGDKFDPAPLPLGLLPRVIEEFALDESRMIGADASGLALGALAVCAAALPDRVQLQVKQNNPNWLESARIWVGLIGDPSRKKTPIINRCTKSLKQIDIQMCRDHIAAKERFDALPADQQKTAPRPRMPRLRLDDTTIEGAQEVLKDSPDGVLAIQNELSGWFGAMDKYSNNRGAAKDRGFWLQCYDGGSYSINRIKRGAIMVENLSVSLLGGIQPDAIRKIAADAVDDGLLQRLIPITLGRATVSVDEPMGDAGRRFDALVERLHATVPPLAPLRFDAGAQVIRAELERKHLKMIEAALVNKKMSSHIGKYDGLFARLCLVWHCIENSGDVIPEATARRVADFLHKFLMPHAFAFYAGMLDLSDDHERLAAVAGYILAHKLERVTNRDVQRSLRSMRGLKQREIEGVFEQLDSLNWLTRIPGPRPSLPPHWLVNPEVHRLFTERAERETAERARLRELITDAAGLRRKDLN
jgi:hypothetical protein